MAKIDSEILNEETRRWIAFRKDFQSRGGQPRPGEVTEFISKCNASAHRLAATLELPEDPELYSALSEMAANKAAQLLNPRLLS